MKPNSSFGSLISFAEISAAVSPKEHHRKRCDKNAFSHAFSFVLDL